MHALEKVAWTELIVSVLATVVVILLYPLIGYAALAGFALLGLLGFTPLFLRKRGYEVVRDERDQEIEQRSSWFGFGAAWFVTLLVLAAITMWHSHQELDVSTGVLSALIWFQFALCYGIKGGASLIQYRSNARAT